MTHIRTKTAQLIAYELATILTKDPEFPDQDISTLREVIRKLCGDDELTAEERELAAYTLGLGA